MPGLRDVAEVLASARTPFALIGAGAMAVHGISRSTADLDLLVLDPACLRPAYWTALRERGAAVSVHVGDTEDPLAGVVRIRFGSAAPLDVVVGKAAWDIAQLLACEGRAALEADVEARLAALPADARALWDRVRRPSV